MICNPSCHGWRHAKGPMNQAEVIRPEVQSHGSFQVRQFARESQCEPVKSSNLHSQRQILSFDIGRTNLAVIGDAQHFRNLRSRHARRGIAARPRIRSRVKLGNRGIGGTVAKVSRNGRTIRSPRICTDLCRALNASAQIIDEMVGRSNPACPHERPE